MIFGGMLMRCPTCLADSESVYSDGTPILDCFGDHALHCKDGNAMRTALWHDPIVQQFLSATRLAQVPGTAEPAGAMLTSGKRPDVMVTQPGCRRILTDVITCSSTQKRNCCGAATTPGHAADQGQLDKERDWSALAEAGGGLFFALPAECTGRLGHTSLAFLRRLSSPMVRVAFLRLRKGPLVFSCSGVFCKGPRGTRASDRGAGCPWGVP